MIYDVAIVGSGSSGTAAAISCRKYGLKPIIITNETLKSLDNASCHLQSIHPGVLTLLEELGLLGAIGYSSCAMFEGIVVNGEFNNLGKSNEKWTGHHLQKNKFDKYLLKYLINNDFDVIKGNKITNFNIDDNDLISLQAKGEIIYSKYLIDATGRNRKFGRLMKLRELTLSPSMSCWTGTSENDKNSINQNTTSFNSSEDGWVWTAPGKKNQFTWVKLIVDKKESFINPYFTQRIIDPIKTYNVRWRIFRPIFNKNILLCGDAAGILDPAAGQGILIAITSAMMASQTIAKCIYNNNIKEIALVEYDQWFLSQFEDKVENLKQYYSDLGINF